MRLVLCPSGVGRGGKVGLTSTGFMSRIISAAQEGFVFVTFSLWSITGMCQKGTLLTVWSTCTKVPDFSFCFLVIVVRTLVEPILMLWAMTI